MPKSSPLLEAHRLAMLAKHTIFKAQDATSTVIQNEVRARDREVSQRGRAAPHKNTIGCKLERRLARVRAELEALDREVRAVVPIDAPLGVIPAGEG